MTRNTFTRTVIAVLLTTFGAHIEAQRPQGPPQTPAPRPEAAPQVPLTLDHLLKATSVGDARFEPGGGLVFDLRRPYEEGSSYRNYARPVYPRWHLSAMYLASAQAAGEPRPLFDQPSSDDYQIDALSPDGAYMSYLRATSDRVVVGVHPRAGGTVREFDAAVDDLYAPLWISPTKLLYAVIAAEYAPQAFTGQMARNWKDGTDGRRASISRLGSGRYAPSEDTARSLVIADARTGEMCRLASGYFIDRALSPDGKQLAAVRRAPQGRLDPVRPVDSFRLPHERTELFVFDLDACGTVKPVAASLDVLPGTLGWSRSGKRLAFVARRPGADWRGAGLWTWDADKAAKAADKAGDNAVSPVELGAWRSGVSYEDYWSVRPPRFAWLGDELVLEASRGGERSQSAWVKVRPGAEPLDVTAEFAGGALQIVTVTDEALLVIGKGQLWAVAADGTRRRMMPQHDDLAGIWRQSEGTLRYGASAVRPGGRTLVLQTRPKSGSRNVLFADARTGAVHAEVKIPAEARIADADVEAYRVAFTDEQHNVGILGIADAKSPVRVVRRFNEHLRDVVGGQPIRLEHKGPDGKPRESWLLMPLGWTPAAGPIATVVQIYPGKDDWRSTANASIGSFTRLVIPPILPQLLATHGYAVLMPGVPLPTEVPRDSIPGLADAVSAAVDAAIAAGYADKDRLAIEGHSYGGYGTMGVIAQTGRFKAALAMSGLYDLITKYGTPRIEQRLVAETGYMLSTASTLESGQEGIGAPPWRDVERYLRNSPLMSVEKIETPVMLVHGDLDPTVSMSQSEEMFTALTRLNRDAVFLRYWGEGHTLNSPANIRDFWSRRLAWYREHLGPAFTGPFAGGTVRK